MSSFGLQLSDHEDPEVRLKRESGAAFFGIDAKYLVEIQKKEIFHLVKHGFSYESLCSMSLEERRLHFHQLVEYNKPKNEQPPPGKLGYNRK